MTKKTAVSTWMPCAVVTVAGISLVAGWMPASVYWHVFGATLAFQMGNICGLLCGLDDGFGAGKRVYGK